MFHLRHPESFGHSRGVKGDHYCPEHRTRISRSARPLPALQAMETPHEAIDIKIKTFAFGQRKTLERFATPPMTDSAKALMVPLSNR